jgi:hypothetical protein
MKKKTLRNEASTKFEVGARLPDKLPRQTREFFENAVTPQKAFDIAEKVSRLIGQSDRKILSRCLGSKSVV